MSFPVSLADIRIAADALEHVVIRTPLLENPDVNAMLGGRLLLKAENMQVTGAFKIRGAYNCIRQFTPAEKTRGAISYSSGNHALGVAQAARMLGTSALIIMPSDVPAAKIDAVRRMGAEIQTFERDSTNSDELVAALAASTGRLIVPPSADARVLAGAGTVALELHAQAGDIDAVLVPCGGGGLSAATAIAYNMLARQTRVYAAEPELFDDTARSLMAGQRLANPKGRRSICDAIMTPMPNALTFPINHALLAGGLTATDAEVRTAMGFAFAHYKIVVEPGAAIGLAAILAGRIDIKGKTLATILTGGNIDAARFSALLQETTQ